MPRWGRVIRQADGTALFVDGSMPPPQPCHVCGAPSAFLCDYPTEGGTCDRAMCGQHRFRPLAIFGRPDLQDIDYCREHAPTQER